MQAEYLRLRVNPKNLAAPLGFRDIYLSSTGALLLESPDGSKIEIGKITSASSSDGTAVLSLEEIQFNTADGVSDTVGAVGWDSANETVTITLNHGVQLQVGEEILYHVENNSGADIADGDPVEYAGTVGNSGKLRVRAWTGANADTFMGFATSPIAHGEHGYVTHFGKVRGIQTNGGNYGESWDDGDIIYANSAGDLTNVLPQEREYVFAAIVVSAHPSNGTLFSRPRAVLDPSAPGAYADDAAAALAGITVNQIYRKTDGTVAWRQT